MESVKCVILSHKRAQKVDTLKTVSNCSVCIPKSQQEEYKEYNPDVEIITHPDSVVGLSPKIRWVYEKFGNVMMLDDDLNAMKRLYAESGDIVKVKPDDAYSIIQKNSEFAKELGVYFWGFGKGPTPFTYSGFSPFSLSGFVIGGSIGFHKGFKMVLPDECIAACDYYLSAINAYFHRMTFIDQRFCFSSKEGTFKSTGGTADFRTIETEKSDLDLLIKHFGESIEVKGKNPARRLQHNYERTLKVHF